MLDYYHIENDFFRLEVTSLGAELKKMFAKEWQRDLLWCPASENNKKIWNRSAPVLFPIVGKLKGDTYNFKGKIYHMSQHGFARDKKFKFLRLNENELEFFLEADQETFSNYPFYFELLVKHRLIGKKVEIVYLVKNTDRQDIYFSIGAHPAFVTLNVENYKIYFEKNEDSYFGTHNGLVNWQKGNRLSSNILVPNKELFLSDALIFKNVKSRYIDLIEYEKGEVIRINTANTPYLGIWAKGEIPFICIEPWYGVSDDNDHDQNFENKRGIQKLAMGETFNFSYSIELKKAGEKSELFDSFKK